MCLLNVNGIHKNCQQVFVKLLQKVRKKDPSPCDFQNKKGVTEALWSVKNLYLTLSLEN